MQEYSAFGRRMILLLHLLVAPNAQMNGILRNTLFQPVYNFASRTAIVLITVAENTILRLSDYYVRRLAVHGYMADSVSLRQHAAALVHIFLSGIRAVMVASLGMDVFPLPTSAFLPAFPVIFCIFLTPAVILLALPRFFAAAEPVAHIAEHFVKVARHLLEMACRRTDCAVYNLADPVEDTA